MKKKIISTIFAFAFILTAVIGLAACDGDQQDNKIKISVGNFSDDGVTQISLYYADYEKMQEIAEENEEIRETNIQVDEWNEEHRAEIASGEMQAAVKLEYRSYDLKNGGYLYSYGNSNTVSLNPSTYYLVVTLQVDQAYRIEGGLGNFDLKLEVNGETYEGLYLEDRDYGMPFGHCYFWMIGEEISSNTTIKVKGNTTIKTYVPFVFANYKTDQSDAVYDDLMFKVSVDGTPIKYNNSEEIAVGNLIAAIDANPANYHQVYYITCYFAEHNKFFTGSEMFDKFFKGHYSPTLNASKLEVSWDFASYYSDPVTLDFSAFDGVTENDLSNVVFDPGRSAYEEEYTRFIVDGTEKTTLTLAEYRNANVLEVKVKVSEWQIPDWRGRFTTEYSEEDIAVSISELDDGYYYVTFNLGDYKSYEHAQNYWPNYFGIRLTYRG